MNNYYFKQTKTKIKTNNYKDKCQHCSKTKITPAFHFSNKATIPNDSVYNILQAKGSFWTVSFKESGLMDLTQSPIMGGLESGRIHGILGSDCEFLPKQCKKPSHLNGWPAWIAKSQNPKSELTSGRPFALYR